MHQKTLNAREIFQCRVALALGLLPSEVEEIPSRDYAMLQLYWQHEPWGPWRDNLHAAIIACEVVRPYLKKGAKVSIDSFMVRHPLEVAEEKGKQRRAAARNLFQFFKSVAVKRPRNG